MGHTSLSLGDWLILKVNKIKSDINPQPNPKLKLSNCQSKLNSVHIFQFNIFIQSVLKCTFHHVLSLVIIKVYSPFVIHICITTIGACLFYLQYLFTTLL